ncbi:MAG TPA: S49 family peptidase [Telluria sp.]|jgi:signal peptide peptidase SppA
MKILDVLSGPWAIEPGKLLELQAIYATHLRGEQIDIAAVEARLGRPLANEQKAYEIVDGVAIISIEGVVAKKMNMFGAISGGASSQIARQSVIDAHKDSAVHSIIQFVDSPGGTVDGTQTYSETVFESRGQKPIVTLGSGIMASAAYWFGSAASAVYIADGTTSVGSIGVVVSHKDISGAEAARGIKTTELSAGKYKRIASEYAPLSEDGRQSIQDRLDYMYSLFVGDVAKYRGVSAEKVLADMAEGRIFTGQQAVDAGLVDGIMSLDALIVKLNQERGMSSRSATSPRATPARALNSPTTPEGKAVNKDEIIAQHPALAAELRADGAAAERQRIQAIEGQAIAGHEALINKLKFDGTSTAGDAAMAVLAAEKASRTAHAAAAANEAPKPLALTPPPTVVQQPAAQDEKVSREDMNQKAHSYMAAHPGTSFVAAFKAIGGK